VIATIQTGSPAESPRGTDAIDPLYRQIRDVVYNVSGINNAEEKLHLLSDGCARRINVLNLKQPRESLDHLIAHPSRDGELRHLLNEITIGETCLFRSQPRIDALRKEILPEFPGEKVRQAMKRRRIWSAGCCTVEGPYTLAMSMMEESEGALNGWRVEIIATDLSDRSVVIAKAGIYGGHALRNSKDSYKRKYFLQAENGKLQVKPEVKKLISFSRWNLSEDQKMLFMKGMDLTFCCNVLIYFDGPSKTNVVNHFIGNLNFGGYFFLGTSESLFHLNERFQQIHCPGTIAYWKPSLTGKKP
jgi:chemotaxis protein methyltransferase CheR